MSGWRYQPVIVADDDNLAFSLCEVYFDDDDRVETWTESPSIAPSGETPEELSQDLMRMIIDAACWAPIMFDSLKVGMKIPPAVDMETRRKIADDIDRYAAQFEAAKTTTQRGPQA